MRSLRMKDMVEPEDDEKNRSKVYWRCGVGGCRYSVSSEDTYRYAKKSQHVKRHKGSRRRSKASALAKRKASAPAEPAVVADESDSRFFWRCPVKGCSFCIKKKREVQVLAQATTQEKKDEVWRGVCQVQSLVVEEPHKGI